MQNHPNHEPGTKAESGGVATKPWGKPPKGPVETLCDEIGFRFDKRLERVDVFRAFVGELVDEISHRRDMQTTVHERLGGKAPSEDSAHVLELTRAMLAFDKPRGMMTAAGLVHEACHRLNPDDAYPTDHLIDMLSGCASAIRFGLEVPCRSRHAADAADHVWKQVYGVSLFDSHSPAWGKSWACAKLQSAIISLLPPHGAPLRDHGEEAANPKDAQ